MYSHCWILKSVFENEGCFEGSEYFLSLFLLVPLAWYNLLQWLIDGATAENRESFSDLMLKWWRRNFARQWHKEIAWDSTNIPVDLCRTILQKSPRLISSTALLAYFCWLKILKTSETTLNSTVFTMIFPPRPVSKGCFCFLRLLCKIFLTYNCFVCFLLHVDTLTFRVFHQICQCLLTIVPFGGLCSGLLLCSQRNVLLEARFFNRWFSITFAVSFVWFCFKLLSCSGFKKLNVCEKFLTFF